MLQVVLRGQAKRTLEALGKRPGNAWLDIWSEIEAFRHGSKPLSVRPGSLGLHRLKVDGSANLAVLGLNRPSKTLLIVERIDIYPPRKASWKYGKLKR